MFVRLAVVALLAGAIVVPGPLTGAGSAYAASTKKKSKSDYTAKQRAEIMDYARKLCRKKYGASSTVYRLDYRMKRVTCVPPGY